MAIHMTRTELYSAIWSAPMQVVSQSLGVSDTGLAKICKKANVPAPYRGYWRQLKTGHSPVIPPLPDPENDAVVAAAFKIRSERGTVLGKAEGMQLTSAPARKPVKTDVRASQGMPSLNGVSEYKRMMDQLDLYRAADELLTNLSSLLSGESERVRQVAAAWMEIICAERKDAHPSQHLLREFRAVAAGRKTVHWWTDQAG